MPMLAIGVHQECQAVTTHATPVPIIRDMGNVTCRGGANHPDRSSRFCTSVFYFTQRIKWHTCDSQAWIHEHTAHAECTLGSR